MSLKHELSVETGLSTVFESGSLPTLAQDISKEVVDNEKQEVAPSLPEVPEGGLQAWLTVLGV
jgi:hypothetical protein